MAVQISQRLIETIPANRRTAGKTRLFKIKSLSCKGRPSVTAAMKIFGHSFNTKEVPGPLSESAFFQLIH